MLAAAVLGVIALGAGWRAVSLQQQVTQLSAAASDLNSLLTAPDATTVTGPVTSGGQATVVISRTRGQAALATAGLAPAPAGHVYQAWFIPSTGSPVSAGFVSEHAALALLTGSPATAAAVGVTLEPAGGSAAPTTDPVIAIPLPTSA
jgi:anti-sigma-K factor RskA